MVILRYSEYNPSWIRHAGVLYGSDGVSLNSVMTVFWFVEMTYLC